MPANVVVRYDSSSSDCTPPRKPKHITTTSAGKNDLDPGCSCECNETYQHDALFALGQGHGPIVA